MFNKQEIFDIVARGILKQGGESWNNGCAYRGKNGRKCAIGWLIPDNLYTSDMEGDAFSAVIRKGGIINHNNFDGDEYTFYGALQYIHDHSGRSDDWENLKRCTDKEFMIKWKQKMIEFAGKENLSTKVFEEIAIPK